MSETTTFLAIAGAAAAGAYLLASRSSTTAQTNEQMASRGFVETDIDELLEGIRAASGSSMASASELSGSGSGDTLTISPTNEEGATSLNDLANISEGSFEQAIVERTGYLSSGFDAAGRIAQLNSGETVGL